MSRLKLQPKYENVRNVRKMFHACCLLQVDGGWNLSASIPLDRMGQYTLRLTRRVDVTRLRHISTRRSSEYDVAIPHMEVRCGVDKGGVECRGALLIVGIIARNEETPNRLSQDRYRASN